VTAPPDAAWDVEFAPWVREIVRGRDTPAGAGQPWCWVCGLPVTGRVVHVHHVLMRSAGGRGLPSNGIVVHGEEQGPGCHATRIHRPPGQTPVQGPEARQKGWLRSRHAAKPGVYRLPVWCAWRRLPGAAEPGMWVVLFDEPDEQGRWWVPEAR
jgi:hypothetical protein